MGQLSFVEWGHLESELGSLKERNRNSAGNITKRWNCCKVMPQKEQEHENRPSVMPQVGTSVAEDNISPKKGGWRCCLFLGHIVTGSLFRVTVTIEQILQGVVGETSRLKS